MPEDAVNKITETAKGLAPISPEFRNRHLFSGRDFDLYDEKGNYEERRQRLDEARQAAIAEIIDAGGLDAALKFSADVASPYEVGRALGVVVSDEIEKSILPVLLDSTDEPTIRVVAGFVWARFWSLKMKWVDEVLDCAWYPEHRAKFLTILPFVEEIWARVATSLGTTHERSNQARVSLHKVRRE